jgi:hypothetical protein
MASAEHVRRGKAPKVARAQGRSPVAWEPRKQLERAEWVAIGRRLGGISRCNQWWLGDWIRYGAGKWGERYVRAAKITGYDPRSVANMSSIASAFELSRRREHLTWSHHAAVVGLPRESQDEWLERAAAKRWSVADLRIELRAAQKKRVEIDAQPESNPSQPRLICPRCGHRLPGKGVGQGSGGKGVFLGPSVNDRVR